MAYSFEKIAAGRVLYAEPDKIWVARGMSFCAMDYNGRRIGRRFRVGSWLERCIGLFRLSRQALRVGLHHLVPLGNGNLFVTSKRKSYILDAEGRVVNVFSGYQGNKPGHQGVCVTPDGTIFFAEYMLNPQRDKRVDLYRSTDNGQTFQVVKSFAAGDIRHLHFVKWDEYEQCLWLGTGDYGENNHECRLYRSGDNGDTWELIGQGSQDWRAIGVCFTKDYLVWGTDAGSTPDQNHLVRMSRATRQIEVVGDLEGPCHGCASYKDGRSFYSTGVEGGENEKDNLARLKELEGGHLTEIYKAEKDCWPLIVQYGVMRFPLGTDACDRVCFTSMGLKRGGEVVLRERK